MDSDKEGKICTMKESTKVSTKESMNVVELIQFQAQFDDYVSVFQMQVQPQFMPL